jgi:hypothetical protein
VGELWHISTSPGKRSLNFPMRHRRIVLNEIQSNETTNLNGVSRSSLKDDDRETRERREREGGGGRARVTTRDRDNETERARARVRARVFLCDRARAREGVSE